MKWFYVTLNIAREPNYWYVAPCMELAYLCRMRMSEVLDLTDANYLESGLLVKRRKGSKNNITEWTPRLSAAWNIAIKTRNQILRDRKQPTSLHPENRPLIISERTGDKIDTSSLKTALSRIGKIAEKTAK